MQIMGSKIHASPTNLTDSGRAVLKRNPGSLGSLGIAISEAVEDAAKHDDTKYCLGSVMNHVVLHQTIIGLETKKQLEIAGEKADIITGCVGGGSNFSGMAAPFIADKMKGDPIRLIGVEPSACPTLTKGPYRYDFGDEAKMTPLVKMYTLGHSFEPSGIHAGGLRYHGDSPILSMLVNKKLVEAAAYHQNPVFEAAMLFAKTEGIIPAPETSHAIKAAVDEAIKCRETNKEKCIVITFSGHGHFDLAAYDAYLNGKLEDFALDTKKIDEALKECPDF
jgi:tryptophan synthase beta chain